MILHVFCWRMYLTSYAQHNVACQWLAWLFSMFKIWFYAAIVTCDPVIAQVESVLFVSAWYVRLDFQYNRSLRRNYPDVQPCGMSDWQMTHSNDIAYASWDFNSMATLLFGKQIVKANMKENIKPTFCEGNPPAMDSPHTGPPKFHPSDPCNVNPLVTSGFTAHRDNNVINYWMTNYITVT